MPWTFYRYVSETGRDEIADWVNKQPAGTATKLKAQLNARLNELRLLERFGRPWVGQLRGDCAGLFELVLKVDKTQYRPIGCYGPAKTGEFTLLPRWTAEKRPLADT